MSDKSGETALMFAVGIIVLFFWLMWYIYEAEITQMVAYTRFGYLWALGHATDHFDAYYAALDRRLSGNVNLSWDQVKAVSDAIGDVMKWPVMAFLAYCCYWMLQISPKRKFRTVFNLESFIKIQAKCWPVIAPIINFNPLKNSQRIPGTKIPRKLPPFAESLSPEEWVAWLHLPFHEGLPEKEAVTQAFIQQLGRKWEGVRSLREHQRALLAAFTLRGNQKRNESDELLGEIAKCWSIEHGLRLTLGVRAKIDAVLNDKGAMAEVMKELNRHAYVVTALLGALKWARERGGVLASPSFLWLRAVDRALWYPLNNLGRRSYHAEAAGVMAHFMAENLAKRALPIPRVDTAVPALLDYLKQMNPTYPEAEPLAVRDNAKLKMS